MFFFSLSLPISICTDWGVSLVLIRITHPLPPWDIYIYIYICFWYSPFSWWASSRLDQSLEEVLLHHLLDVLPGAAPEHLLALQLVARVLVTREVSYAWSWAATGRAQAAPGLAVEHLAEQVEEGQQLVHAADHVQREQQVARLPGEGADREVLLRVFLRITGSRKRKWGG